MTRRRVLLYVQHLLGIGHLKRALTLARAFADEALEVTLVSGGLPVAGLAPGRGHWVQLPPAAAADESFKLLVDAEGTPIDDAWRERRREALLRAWRGFEPHVLVLELFPFGRRQMRFELLPWLDAATASARRPVIVSSVRDVLGGGQRDPRRQTEMLHCFERYFDHLLVHGDRDLIPFERTFRHAAALGERLHYTGYTVDRSTLDSGDAEAGRDEVVVSAGGGAVGARLLETAILARPLCLLADRTWRVLAGVHATPAAWQRLNALAAQTGAGRVIVEHSRADLASVLRTCSLSISQAGYNTVMEILDAGARAVVVPFAGGGETEQTLRARILAERGSIDWIAEPDLTPTSLALAVDRAMTRAPVCAGRPSLEGARNSARLIAGWAENVPW